MAKIISASIDLTKIDKSKLVHGSKGIYANITITINDEKDKFDNDCSISLNQSKEERESKAAKVYIGNGKTVWKSGSDNLMPWETLYKAPEKAADAPAPVTVGDDLPF